MQREEILAKGNEILSELEERVGATVAQNALDNVRKEFEQALKAVITAVTELFECLLDCAIKDFQRATALDPEEGDLSYSHMPVRDVLQNINKAKELWASQGQYDFNDLVKLAKKTRDLEIMAEEKLGLLDSIPQVKVIVSQERVKACVRDAVEVVIQGGKRPQYLIQPMPGRCQVLLGNLDTFEVQKLEAAIQFPRNCSSCQVCDRVFVCGGLNMSQERVRACWCVLETCAVLKKADMLEIRSALATAHCSGWLYATGGLNGQHRLATCERYRIQKDQWEPFPVLNTPRSSHAICSFNDRFLYVFCGGQAGKLSLTTVERIEIDMDATWTTIELAKQDEDWLPRSMIGVEQISANELVIYGDQNRNNLTYLLTHKKHGASLQKLVTQIVPAVYGYRYTRVVLGGFLFSFTDTFDYMWSYEHVTKQWNCCGKGGDIKMEGEQLNY